MVGLQYLLQYHFQKLSLEFEPPVPCENVVQTRTWNRALGWHMKSHVRKNWAGNHKQFYATRATPTPLPSFVHCTQQLTITDRGEIIQIKKHGNNNTKQKLDRNQTKGGRLKVTLPKTYFLAMVIFVYNFLSSSLPPTPPSFWVKSYEVQQMVFVWKNNMQKRFILSWITCLDKYMSI